MHSFFGRIECAEHASDPQRIQSGFLVIVRGTRHDSATTPPRSSLPGCLGLHEGEGVRTVGRLHPGQAGQRLQKQRPNVSAEM